MPPNAQYPKPLIIPPRQLPHKQSLIILHGRGDTALGFGPELLRQQPFGDALHSNRMLPQLLPHASFIFPTAAPRRARLYGRSVINQWFDNWELTAPNKHADMMVEGLRESSEFVQDLVRQEARKVGAENVVLGGLSQGCATVLNMMFLNSGATNDTKDEIPAAYFGMCGWLPFAEMIEHEAGLLSPEVIIEDGGNESDPFQRDPPNKSDQTKLAAVRSMLRTELEIPTPEGKDADTIRPVFIGHGALDDKVSIALGRQAARCLKGVDIDVLWKEYEHLDHWYSDDMLCDILTFLRDKIGWKIEE